MNKIIFLILVINLTFFLNSCTNKNIISNNKVISETPESLYKIAMISLQEENYDDAFLQFNNIYNKFPLSNEAIQSQLMMAFIEYVRMNYSEAIFKFNQIISRYPSHKNIDYAFYMKAISYFEQIENEALDGYNGVKALENFNQIINRFPESKYTRDSEQKIILVKENIAAKHMNIALFYYNQKKYSAAMNRYKKVIDEHSKSKFTPEALYRLVEIYYLLGMIDDANKTAAVISYNYPKSQWYKYSYNLLVKNNSEKDNHSLLNKFFSFLNKDDKEE